MIPSKVLKQQDTHFGETINSWLYLDGIHDGPQNDPAIVRFLQLKLSSQGLKHLVHDLLDLCEDVRREKQCQKVCF